MHKHDGMTDRPMKLEFIGWSDVTVICSHNTVSMLWGNMAYCMNLSGEDLSCHSNKTESAVLSKCPYYHYLTKKVGGAVAQRVRRLGLRSTGHEFKSCSRWRCVTTLSKLFTHVPLSPSSIIWYRPKGRWCSEAGEVTAGLAESNGSLPQSPAGWLPVHRDQLRAQHSVSSMGSLYLLLRKWCHNNKHFSELAPHRGSKTAGTDMKKLHHCHPMYIIYHAGIHGKDKGRLHSFDN